MREHITQEGEHLTSIRVTGNRVYFQKIVNGEIIKMSFLISTDGEIPTILSRRDEHELSRFLLLTSREESKD